MTIDLEPCPFCGDEDPEITGEGGWVWVACTTGSDCAGRGPDSDDEASAILSWNTRAPTAAARERDGLREALTTIAEGPVDDGFFLKTVARQALNTGDQS